MNTTENNKLIAEFMGIHEIMLDAYSNYDLNDIYNVLDIKNSLVGIVHESNLQFNSSWDWLMPVVEKIETIDRRDEKGKFLLQFNSDSVNWNNTPPTITGINKKHATYKAVVEFIKWYNKNKED